MREGVGRNNMGGQAGSINEDAHAAEVIVDTDNVITVAVAIKRIKGTNMKMICRHQAPRISTSIN